MTYITDAEWDYLKFLQCSNRIWDFVEKHHICTNLNRKCDPNSKHCEFQQYILAERKRKEEIEDAN